MPSLKEFHNDRLQAEMVPKGGRETRWGLPVGLSNAGITGRDSCHY